MKTFSMCRLILNYCNLIFLYLVCFFSCVHCSDRIQDTEHISTDLDSLLKRLEDKANQQIVKDKFCAQANIKDMTHVQEGNAITVKFKLPDKQFQDCFKYFKITLEKKWRVINQLKVPSLHHRQEEISHRFENISCGIYEVVVQPCFDDRYCPLISWRYEKSINVTSDDCIGTLEMKNISDENNVSVPVVFIIICLLIPLTFGILFYIYKKGIAQVFCCRKKLKDLTKLKLYLLYIYYKNSTMKKKVIRCEAAITQRLTDSWNIETGTIHSEVLKGACLDNVNDWLTNALRKIGKDGILQQCILLESSEEMDEENIVENEIFSYIQDKVRNNHEAYHNLLFVQLEDPNYIVSRRVNNAMYSDSYF